MKNIRKIVGIAALIAVIVLPLAACGGGGGGKPNPASDFQYDMTADGKGVIIFDWLSKAGGKVVIPSEIEGYPVVGIGSRAFAEPNKDNEDRQLTQQGIKRITEVVMPDTITEFYAYQSGGAIIGMFNDCTELKSVTLSKNLREIASNAFNGCVSLTSITIPESVTTIEDTAFKGCENLAEVKLPNHPINYTAGNGYNAAGTEIVVQELTEENAFLGAFVNCPKLSLATRKAIQDSGYKGDF